MPVVAGTQYAQSSDLTNLGLIGSAVSNVSAATITAALSAASAVADSYIQGQYILPLSFWGMDLVRVVCIIAAYDILTSRGYGAMQGADENIRKRYEDAIQWLRDVGVGKESISGVVDSSIGNSGAISGSSDGSVVTSTQGGIQIVTSNVRGWTSRGTSPRSGDGFWDKGS
jgi:phage gp36-like protein